LSVTTLSVAREALDHRRHRVVAKDLAPASERRVAGDDQWAARQPANKPAAVRLGIKRSHSQRESPQSIVSTGARAGPRARPKPTRGVTGGIHGPHRAISPGSRPVRAARSGGRYAGGTAATRPDSTRIDRV